jgi:hypothetical protein
MSKLRAADVPDYDSEELHRCVSAIERSGVNFVAIDFDLTLISIHTFGKWAGNAIDLSTKVRGFFLEFIPLVMSRGISVAIVTFSGEVKLIQQVIHTLFPDLAAMIPVRGKDLSWDYQGMGAKDGKQKHMASAAEELNNMYSENNAPQNLMCTVSGGAGGGGLSITRATTLLIDDDLNNIMIALKNQLRAVMCDPERNRNMIEDLLAFE